MEVVVTASERARVLIDVEQRLGANNYRPLDVVLTSGRGVWVTDVDGRTYVDCLAAYSAVNQDHCHPRIVEAMREQASRLTLTSRAFRNDQLAPLYEDLERLTGAHKVLLMNGGVEAVESAVKCVRKWAYEVKGVPDGLAEVIVCADNFHGRTIGVVGFSTDPDSTGGFGPFAPGFVTVPYGDAQSLERAITPNTAAVLLEPIQGEAGVVIPPDGYLRAVRRICTDNRVLMVVDEIQTGLGRTGTMLAERHEGVEADVTLIGKALSGGFYPVSAVLSNEAVLGVLGPGQHGSTYGGNPLACAVSRAALAVIEDEDLCGNSDRMGRRMTEGLSGLLGGGRVTAVRGRGLMIAVDVDPSFATARQVCERLADVGVLAKDTHGVTVRVSPPLVIGPDEVDIVLERFARVLS